MGVAQSGVSRVIGVLDVPKTGGDGMGGTFAGVEIATDASGSGFGCLDFCTDAVGELSRAGKSRFAFVIGVFTEAKCDTDAVTRNFACAKSGSHAVIALSKRRKSAVTNA